MIRTYDEIKARSIERAFCFYRVFYLCLSRAVNGIC